MLKDVVFTKVGLTGRLVQTVQTRSRQSLLLEIESVKVIIAWGLIYSLKLVQKSKDAPNGTNGRNGHLVLGVMISTGSILKNEQELVMVKPASVSIKKANYVENYPDAVSGKNGLNGQSVHIVETLHYRSHILRVEAESVAVKTA